jgi:transcriptional regulator
MIDQAWMYLPKQFEETRTEVLHALIRSRPFATFVVMTSEGLNIEHIPLLLDASCGQLGVLKGHVARANPILKATLLETDSVAIFQGPHHYITPSWYPTKQQTGKVVPTWNYVVVHAHGRPRFIDDTQWLRLHVEALTQQHEEHRDPSWMVSDAPEEFISTLLGGIVGIEIPITRLSGKWKLGQTRPAGDRIGMVEGLLREGDTRAEALAELTSRSVQGSESE